MLDAFRRMTATDAGGRFRAEIRSTRPALKIGITSFGDELVVLRVIEHLGEDDEHSTNQ